MKKIKLKLYFFATIALSLFTFISIAQTTIPLSNGTWNVPAGVTSIEVECWGAGGGGATAASNGSKGGGAGGGAYASSVIAVNPGDPFDVVVGVGGGAGIDGGNSTFGTTLVVAVGGKGVAADVTTGGLGGQAGNCTGTVKNSGGNGANGAGDSGGGGGAAGPSNTGGNANTTTGGTGFSPAPGGAGGDGVGGNSAGNPGLDYGGGGSGGSKSGGANRAGGSGGNGYVQVTYTVAASECPASTSVTPTATQTLCVGSATDQLTAVITTTGTGGTPSLEYQWYYNDATDSNDPTHVSATAIGGATSSTYTPLNTISEVGNRWYFCVGYATDNGCGQSNDDPTLASNTVQVTIVEPPTTANAGSNQNICVSGNATLAANNPTVGTGAWSIVSGPSTNPLQLSSTAAFNATFTPDGGTGDYVLRWTISNSPCTPSTSDVTITADPEPTVANAGGNQEICDGSGATLAANAPTIGTGAWSIVSGPSPNLSQFNNTANNAATFTPDGGTGTYALRWTISNSTCTPSTSDVNIVVITTPAIGSITGSTTVPSGTPDLVYSIPEVTGATDYVWTVPGNPGAWTITSPDPQTYSITVTSGTNSGSEITVYAVHPCGNTGTATLIVNIGAAPDCPTSNAVAPSTAQNLNQGDAATQLTATVTTSGGSGTPTLQYQWYYNTTNSNTVAGATLIAGATSQNYTPLTGAPEVGTRYYFSVGYAADNGCGQTNADQSLASNAVEVTVNATGSDCPSSNSIAPAGTQTLCKDDPSTQLTATISTTGGSGTPTLQYQWYYNTANSNTVAGATSIAGATSQNYTPLTSASELGTRYYFSVGYAADNGCAQTNADQSLASNAVEVIVNDVPATPTISGQATPGPNVAGYVYTITSVPDATNYTWTVPEPTAWNIDSGQGTNTITTTSGNLGEDGNITVYVTNACGNSTTATFAVTVTTITDHTTISCASCHVFHNATGNALTNNAANADLCLSCHTSGQMAENKGFTDPDKAIPGTSGTSHSWDVLAANTTYETNEPSNSEMNQRLSGDDPNKKIVCSTCHDQHNSAATSPYLRIDNTDDAMCMDCHSARNVGLYTGGGKGSHPVGITYDETDSRLNLASASTLIANNGDKVLCTTCHGVHDVAGGNLTTDGYLLKMPNDNNLCLDCHNYSTHNNQSCLVCHQVHNTDKSNIYMIRNTIATPNSGNKTVVFTAETGPGSFAGSGALQGVCEVCHTTTTHYRNDGLASDQDHTATQGNQDEQDCTACHQHSGNFSGGDCVTCHQSNFPTWKVSDSHVAHTTKYNFACSTCHSGNNHNDGTKDVAFSGLALPFGADAGLTPTWNGTTCSNIYCHSNGRNAYRGTDGTEPWSGTTGSQAATFAPIPDWNSTTDVSCGLGSPVTGFACHEGPPGVEAATDFLINATDYGSMINDNGYFPKTGSHAPNRGAHYSNSQNLSGNGWDQVQCFWCHEVDAVATTAPNEKYQGTYGTSLHVDGATHFNPRWQSNGGTMVNTITYSYEGSAGHCGKGKTCW